MSTKVKCRLQQYDPAVTEAPFKFITVGEITLDRLSREQDKLGEQFASDLWSECKELGHSFRFYSGSDSDDYDYDVVVRGEFEKNQLWSW